MIKFNTKCIPETLEECGRMSGCRDCLYETQEHACELSVAKWKDEMLKKLAVVFKKLAEEVKYD